MASDVTNSHIEDALSHTMSEKLTGEPNRSINNGNFAIQAIEVTGISEDDVDEISPDMNVKVSHNGINHEENAMKDKMEPVFVDVSSDATLKLESYSPVVKSSSIEELDLKRREEVVEDEVNFEFKLLSSITCQRGISMMDCNQDSESEKSDDDEDNNVEIENYKRTNDVKIVDNHTNEIEQKSDANKVNIGMNKTKELRITHINESQTKLSPTLQRKSAIRRPSKENNTDESKDFQTEIMASFEIIDRSELKEVKSKRDSTAWDLFTVKFKNFFTNDHLETIEEIPPENGRRLSVVVSLEKIEDFEPIQVISLGDNRKAKNENDSLIYIIEEEPNTFGKQSKISTTSIKSINTEINNADSTDHGEVGPIIKKTNIAPKRSAQSFTVADRGRPDNQKRFSVIGSNDFFSSYTLPFMGKPDAKKAKSKTLTQQSFVMFTDGFPAAFPSFSSDRRSLIVLEVYTTERTFVRGLEIIVLLFKRQIESKNLMDEKELNIVFSNVQQILDLNKQVLDDIYDRVSNWSDEQMIGDVFMKYEDGFKMYSEYCINYDNAENYLKQKQKKKKEFDNLLNSCYLNPVCLPGLTLPSYLITVIQRIPRYILLFKDLLKRTALSHPDYENIQNVVKMMEKSANFLNDQLKQAQCAKALEALQTQITGLKAYYTPDRQLLHEGSVSLLSSKKVYQCVLFNDLLVFAIKTANKQSSVELVLDLKVVWVEDLLDLDPQTTKNDSVALYTPDCPYNMYVGKSGEKTNWLKHLKTAIAKMLYGEDGTEETDLDKRETHYIYKNGSVYSGTYFKAKRHGEGTMMWPNEMTYRGEWQDDERNGFGSLEYLNGDIYEGQWMDDKQSGIGTFKYKSGDTLSGEWKKGLRNGQVAINYSNGDKYIGECKDDVIEGVGELTCENGYYYNGQWRRNLKHGKGKLITPGGDEYNGSFSFGKYHGKGVLQYADGSKYSGDFEHGEKSGKGTLFIPGITTYEGEWVNDHMDGKGKMIYANGDEYDGLWVQDMRFGNGVMFYNYGGYYRGEWLNDLKHGTGIMEFQDGRTFDGEWVNGNMSGFGTMKFKQGSYFKGSWKDNQPNGKGILSKPGGWYCDAQWMQGKQYGVCLLKDPANHYEYKGDFVNGKKEGRGVEKCNDSTFEGNFANDMRSGSGKETHADSSSYEGQWFNGQKHGSGINKLVNGLTEHERWNHGCLVESPRVLPSSGLPILQRFL